MVDAAHADLLAGAKALISSLRRGQDVDRDWALLERLVETRIDDICAGFDTRWLVSICDSYADFACDLARRNALLVSVLVNMEKVGQTFIRWQTGYPARLADLDSAVPHRKVRLWDGMTSFNLDIGDVTNNLFHRLHREIAATPLLLRIFETIVARLRGGDTILGTLDQTHGHVFDRDYRWIMAERYRALRESGRVPPHKYDGFGDEVTRDG